MGALQDSACSSQWAAHLAHPLCKHTRRCLSAIVWLRFGLAKLVAAVSNDSDVVDPSVRGSVFGNIPIVAVNPNETVMGVQCNKHGDEKVIVRSDGAMNAF